MGTKLAYTGGKEMFKIYMYNNLKKYLSSLIRNGDVERVNSLLWYPTKHWRKFGEGARWEINAPPISFFT